MKPKYAMDYLIASAVVTQISANAVVLLDLNCFVC